LIEAKVSWRERLKNRWQEGIRHRVTPLGAMMVALLLASGILAISTVQNVFFLLFSLLMASILISSFVNRLMLAGLEIRLRVPEHAMAREPIACQLEIENKKRWIASFALEIVVPVARRFSVPCVEGGLKISVPLNVEWTRRGGQDPMVVELSTRFPFGFSVRRIRLAMRVHGALYPSVRQQAGFDEVLSQILIRQAELASGADAEYSYLREYSAGDDWRRIAWGKSAQSINWIVREHKPTDEDRLRIELDAFSADFERSVNLAAFLVWELHFQSKPIIFVAGDWERPVAEARDAYAVLEFLATVKPKAWLKAPGDNKSVLL